MSENLRTPQYKTAPGDHHRKPDPLAERWQVHHTTHQTYHLDASAQDLYLAISLSEDAFVDMLAVELQPDDLTRWIRTAKDALGTDLGRAFPQRSSARGHTTPRLDRQDPDAILTSATQLHSDLQDEARAEGHPLPSFTAAAKAQFMLNALEMQPLPNEPVTYPTPDGEIAIDVSGGYRKGLLLLYAHDGSALIMLTINGVHQRAYYDKAPRQINGFLRDALRELNYASRASE